MFKQVREINVLQGREGRRDCWARIRTREKIPEWDHLQFDVIPLDIAGKPDAAAKAALKGKKVAPVRIKGTRAYELAPPDPAPPGGARAVVPPAGPDAKSP